MSISVFAHFAPLSPLIGDVLAATLPGGPYQLPATLQPMLLVILHGEIRLRAWPEQPLAQARRLPMLSVCGATTGIRYAWATPGTQILLASVQPGQLPRLFGVSGLAVMEDCVPLEALLPPGWASEWAEQLLQATTAAQQRRQLEQGLWRLHTHHGQRPADLALPAPLLARPLLELADMFSLSPRQFERQFLRSYGQSLRAFRQQARWSQMLIHQVFGRQTLARWADIAADQAYCDQAHLSRDMRRFAGYTPAHLSRQLAADDPALWPYRLSQADALRLFGQMDGT